MALDPLALALSVSEKLGASAPAGVTLDSWQNLVTGLGDPTRDKGLSSSVVNCRLDYNTLTEVYRGDGMAQIIVDVPAGEMTRAGCDFTIEDDEDAAEEVQAILDKKLKILSMQRRGTKWKRLYGGAGILIGVNDGLKLELPVNETRIKSVDYLNVFDASEIRPIDWQANPAKADFGEPTMYQIFPRIFGIGTSVLFEKVHASRVVRMNGIEANRMQAALHFGWGDGVIDRCYAVLRDYANAHGGAAALINDFAQGIYKLKGLASAMGSGREELIRKRIALIDFCRSVLRGVVLDADGEDFERKSTTLAGLPDLLQQISTRLAAEARIPESKMFGTQPGGLSGGKQDGALELWHKEIHADQENELTPGYMKIARYVMLAKDSPTGGKEPDEFGVEWRALSELSETEEATMHLAQAQADELMLINGVLGPETIRTSRFKGDYSLKTTIEEGQEPLPMPDDSQPAPVVSRIDDNGHTVEVKQGETEPAKEGADSKAAPSATEPAKQSAKTPAKKPTAPGAMPGKPGATPAPAPSSGTNSAASQLDPAKTAMAAGQISAVLGIIQEVNNKQISPEQAKGILVSMLYMDPAEADSIIGQPFEPKPPEPSPDTVAKNETAVALAKSKPKPNANK